MGMKGLDARSRGSDAGSFYNGGAIAGGVTTMHPKKPIPFFLMLLILCVAVWGGIDAPAYSGETTRSPPAEPSGQGVQEQTPPVSGHVLRFGVHVSAMGRMIPILPPVPRIAPWRTWCSTVCCATRRATPPA